MFSHGRYIGTSLSVFLVIDNHACMHLLVWHNSSLIISSLFGSAISDSETPETNHLATFAHRLVVATCTEVEHRARAYLVCITMQRIWTLPSPCKLAWRVPPVSFEARSMTATPRVDYNAQIGLCMSSRLQMDTTRRDTTRDDGTRSAVSCMPCLLSHACHAALFVVLCGAMPHRIMSSHAMTR